MGRVILKRETRIMNSRADLMRDFSKYEEIVCLYHFMESRKDKKRVIKKVQQNSVKTSGGHLDIPEASLIEYDTNKGIFSIYEMGERPLTEYEKQLLDEMYNLCTPEEVERDLLTDGSVCYWREKAFREGNKIDGISMERWYRERYVSHSPKDNKVARDPKIKGKLLYTFQFYGSKN